MSDDAKIYVVISDMTRFELLRVLEAAKQKPVREIDTLRDMVRSLYQDGTVKVEDILAEYDGGL